MTGRSRTNSARRWATAFTAATIAWRCARGTASPTAAAANRAFLPRAELAAPRARRPAGARRCRLPRDVRRIADQADRAEPDDPQLPDRGGQQRRRGACCRRSSAHLGDPDPVIAEAARWALDQLGVLRSDEDAGGLIDVGAGRLRAYRHASPAACPPCPTDRDRHRARTAGCGTEASGCCPRGSASAGVPKRPTRSWAVRPIRLPRRCGLRLDDGRRGRGPAAAAAARRRRRRGPERGWISGAWAG